jgi:uridine kinase
MELAAYLDSRRLSLLRSGRPRLLVGICGRAGAGKSTLVWNLAECLRKGGLESRTYSGDWRFTYDSPTRRRWIDQQARKGLTSYLYSINQFNWWDFERIEEELGALARGGSLLIPDAYNRDSGRRDHRVEIAPLPSGIILYENSVLGGIGLLDQLDVIVQVNTSDVVCLRRLLEKDADRRSVSEIAARFLTTSYSENQFFELLERAAAKRVTCDDHGQLSGQVEVHPIRQLPVPVDLLRFLHDPEPRPLEHE